MRASRSPRRWSPAVLIATATIASACASDSTTATPASSTSAASASTSTLPVVTTSPPTTTGAADATVGSTVPAQIDPQASLTQTVDAKFDPPFVLQLPADWTAAPRDRWAFQAYFGDEDFEITFDHTYQEKESVDDAIARLADTTGLMPGPVTPVVVGGLAGKGFVGDSQSAVRFTDSGFHTNDASSLEVIAIPMADGTTVTVFLTAGADPRLGVDALGRLARRIFETVQWS